MDHELAGMMLSSSLDGGDGGLDCERCRRLMTTVGALQVNLVEAEKRCEAMHRDGERKEKMFAEGPTPAEQRHLAQQWMVAVREKSDALGRLARLQGRLHAAGTCVECGVAARRRAGVLPFFSFSPSPFTPRRARSTHGFCCGHTCVCAACAQAMITEDAVVVTCPMCGTKSYLPPAWQAAAAGQLAKLWPEQSRAGYPAAHPSGPG